MFRGTRHRHLLTVTVAAVVILGSCGGGDTAAESPQPPVTEAPGPAGESPVPPETEAEPAAAGEVETSSDAPEGPPVEKCQEPAAEIGIGSEVSETVDNENGKWFYCVEIAEGVTTISFELAAPTDEVLLYVGFPDMEALQGGLGLRGSDVLGPDEQLVLIEPPLFRGELGAFEQAEFVFPGSYYIEVARRHGGVSASFTLRVTSS